MKLLAYAFVLPLALAACAPPQPAPEEAPLPREPEEMAPEVNAELLVSTDSLAQRMGAGDTGVVVLHVGRNRAAYQAGHVPTARFLPLEAIVVEREGIPNELPPVPHLDSVFESVGVSDSSWVVLYGDLGGLAAARAFFTLEYLGHTQVGLLDGGLELWRAEGRPVSTAQLPEVRGRLTPRPQPELRVTAEWIREHLDNPQVVLIDARPPAEYRGEEPGAGVPRPGHIPGAHNLFWREALVSPERPVLKDAEVLRPLYEAADAGLGRVVVAYCRTGVMASHAYFVARYMGYDARLYDGSFIEWSRKEGFPVER